MFLALAASAIVAATAPTNGADAAGAALLDRYATTDRFRSGEPKAIVVAPDGGEVLFLRSAPTSRVHELWTHDVRSGRERVRLAAAALLGGAEERMTPEERQRRERLRQSARGISSYQLSNDGRRVLVPLSGRLFVIERPPGGGDWRAPRELAAGATPADDAHFSPDGASVACVRDGSLHVIDVATGTDRTLVAREGPEVTWGLAEFVAQEEMDRFEGYWWSPDSKWLAVQRTDVTGLERLRIIDPSNPTAKPDENPYPRPGMKNADVRLAVVPAAGGAPVWIEWDHAAYPYLCRVVWPDHGPLTLLVMNREQSVEKLLAADPASGYTTERLEERDSAWLNLPAGAPRWLVDGERFLWIAERDDTGPQLELRDARGAVARLSPPGLRVHRLLEVDEAHAAVWVIASDEPTEAHLWRVDLARPGRVVRAGVGRGVDDAWLPRGASAAIRVRAIEPETGAKRWQVESTEGRSLGTIASVAETPGLVPTVEFETVGPDSMRAFVVRPRDFDPRRRYPVIDWAYAGPHSQRVQRASRRYLLEQWLADHGFIVVTVDGRGTPWRGRSWERAIRGDLIGPALEDHVRGLRELCARHPEMDPDRIGATGWSFGGYYSVEAVAREPATYRAAVAGAPVVDWHDYDTFYTERYLGVPPADSLAYARSSALSHASSLSRPLLVLHGTADDNVYFVNSLKLADALNRADRAWEFLPLPGQTHVVVEAAQIRLIYGRTVEFLERVLGEPSMPPPPN